MGNSKVQAAYREDSPREGNLATGTGPAMCPAMTHPARLGRMDVWGWEGQLDQKGLFPALASLTVAPRAGIAYLLWEAAEPDAMVRLRHAPGREAGTGNMARKQSRARGAREGEERI